MDTDDFWFWIRVILLVAIALFAAFFVTGLFSTIVESSVCRELQAIDPVHEYKYGFWSGCLVKTPEGYWVVHHDYQYIEAGVDNK